MNSSMTHDCSELPTPRTSDTGLVARLAPEMASAELDFYTLADTIHEAVEHAQRERGVTAPQTTWWDAAAAAELLLFHIASTTSE